MLPLSWLGQRRGQAVTIIAKEQGPFHMRLGTFRVWGIMILGKGALPSRASLARSLAELNHREVPMHRISWIFRSLSVSAVLFVTGLGGCYQADLSASRFKCDRPEDTCPSGTQCISGVCQSRVDDPAAPPPADLATSPDLMPAKGCTGSGMLLASGAAKDAYACSGSLSTPTGGAIVLCAGGYHVCKPADSALLAEARSRGRCDSDLLGGFFAADIVAGYGASGALSCEPKGAVTTPALIGCGQENGTRMVDPPCIELVTAAPCDGSVDGWSCTGGLGTATHGVGKPGGVLCCKD